MKRFKYLTLAALVGLWACDSGTGTTTQPPTTGTISGTVTIEGTGASGVTVTLSSGTTTTTGADGTYAFSSVNAGAYTVTISGYASDATFDATTKAATITTAGQVATVNFAGSYIKTSSIVGVVSAGGGALQGVTVTLSGAASASATTDDAGSYSFSGLRAGSYTVTISGYGSQYTFPATSKNQTLGVGESAVVSFSGAYVTTASVSGRMFLDENAKDNTYTAGLEDNLSVANVTVTLELSVGNDITTQTAADGTYSFGNLPPGTFRVSIDATSDALPGNVAFGGTSPQVVTVTAGGNATVNWPFDITQEAVKAYGFLGTDASYSATPGPGITPIEGWAMDLYPTEADAVAGTNALVSNVKTDATGTATFRFDRADDYSPNGGASDQIVFAKRQDLAAPYAMNGETVIEIAYSAKDSLASAPDTFDALYNQLVVKTHAEEIDSDTLAGWNMVMFQKTDTAGAINAVIPTDADGDALYTVTPAGIGSSDGALPDTLWFRLSTAQAGANGLAFDWMPSADRGTVAGNYIMFIWDGTVLPTDTVNVGADAVHYLEANLSFVVHHELDDTVGYTGGDDFSAVTGVEVDLDTLNTDGSLSAPLGTQPGNSTDGTVTFPAASTEYSYVVHARSVNGNILVLNDTTLSLTVDGADQDVAIEDAFAIKTNNNTVSGTVANSLGGGVKSVIVTMEPTADNIQGTATKVDTTDAAGAYSFTGVIEGPYTVSVADIAGKWAFFDTLDAPAAGSADNTDAYSGLRDVQGYGVTRTANFMPRRMDGVIAGQVVNDRDGDNTLDPSDALAGAVINLYDGDGAMVTSATTDASGDYSFTGVREGDYMVQWSTDTPDATVDVLRALSTDSAFVSVTAAADVPAAASANLPSWNYSTTTAANADEADFVFLAKNTIAKGKVQTGAGAGVAGMIVSLRRCQVSNGAVKPPVAVDTGAVPAVDCSSYLGTTVNATTDASGNFEFDNLTEGVYKITPQPGTVGGYTSSAPAAALYLQQNPGDVETYTFTVS